MPEEILTTAEKIKKINTMLESKKLGIANERKQERESRGIAELTGAEKDREEAIILDLTIKELGRNHQKLGQLMMAGMWDMHLRNLYMNLGEAEDIVDWAKNQITDGLDADYIISLAYVVDRVLRYIRQRELEKNPVMDTQSNVPITPEDIIATDGLIAKLKMYSDHFSKLDDDKDRDEFLTTALHEGRTKVAALVEKQKKKAAGAAAQNSSGTSNTTDDSDTEDEGDEETQVDENIIEASAISDPQNPNKFLFTASVTEKQLYVIETALGPILKVRQTS